MFLIFCVAERRRLSLHRALGRLFSSLIIGSVAAISSFSLIELFHAFVWMREIVLEKNEYAILAIIPLALIASYFIEIEISSIKRHIGGTELVIYSYIKHGGRISLRDTVSRATASALTIGMGGSAGMEAPSFLLGGGVSSAMWKLLAWTGIDRRTALLSGAAAGLTLIIGTPIASAAYACEVLYRKGGEWRSFIDALIASLTSFAIAKYLLHISWIPRVWDMSFPGLSYFFHAILLSLFSSFVALLFIASMRSGRIISEVLSRKLMGRYRYVYLLLSALSGALIGLGFIFFPETTGDGKKAIEEAFLGISSFSAPPFYLAIMKIIFVTLTLNFGGSGGLFVPQVFIGSMVGLSYASFFNLPPSLSIIVGISSLLSACSKTPIAAALFGFELGGPIAGGFALLSSSISYGVTYFTSIYSVQPRDRKDERTLSQAFSH